MKVTHPGEVTRLIREIEAGDPTAKERLIEVVYQELRSMAATFMRRERPDHTWEPTDLVHEVYQRLEDQEFFAEARNRKYFFGAAAKAMRRALIDHVRERGAKMRGGDWERVPLDDVLDTLQKTRNVDLLALDEALAKLEQRDQRGAEIVELLFFWGGTLKEVAEQLDVSVSTVQSEWRLARACLYGMLEGGANESRSDKS